MELSSAPLHKGQLLWRGLLLAGEETFLRGVDSRGAQRLDGVFWEEDCASEETYDCCLKPESNRKLAGNVNC